MRNSSSTIKQITCSNCSKIFTTEVWDIIDCTERPDLVPRLYEDTLHQVTCPDCQSIENIDTDTFLIQAKYIYLYFTKQFIEDISHDIIQKYKLTISEFALFLAFEDQNVINIIFTNLQNNKLLIKEDREYLEVLYANCLLALDHACDDWSSDILKSKLHYIKGKAFSLDKQYREAIEELERGKAILINIPEAKITKNIFAHYRTEILSKILFELARLYHATGKLELARLYFKDSLRLFRRLKDQEKIAAVLTALGNLELQMNQLSQADIHLKEAKEYYQAKDRQDRSREVDKLLNLLPEAS